jgi:hypothetical protein
LSVLAAGDGDAGTVPASGALAAACTFKTLF